MSWCGGGGGGRTWLGWKERRRGVVSPSFFFFQHKEVTSDGSQSFLVEVFERIGAEFSDAPSVTTASSPLRLGSRDRDSHSLPMSPNRGQVCEEDPRFVDGRVATRPSCWERALDPGYRLANLALFANSCRSSRTTLSPCEKAILAVGGPAGGKAKQKHRLSFRQTNKGKPRSVSPCSTQRRRQESRRRV